jgi:hypothetical protein
MVKRPVNNMPSIPYLPNEIIGNIISFLLPQDVDNFTSACKLYYDLSKDLRRKHMRRKRFYHTINDNDPMIIPFLVSRPDLLWYARRLIIQNERQNFEDWKRTEDSVYGDEPCPVIIKELLPVVRARLHESGLASAANDIAWLESIKKGIDAPLKVLLLSLAPKIKSLILYPDRAAMANFPSTSFLYHFGKTVYRAALMSGENQPRICPELAEIHVSPQLTRQPYLNYLSLRSYEIAPFFSLPTLESLSIEMYMVFTPIYDIGVEYPGSDMPFRLKHSSIKNLHIESFGGSSCGDFVDMVKGIKALKSFHIKQPEHNFSIYLEALWQSQAATLKELNLGLYNSSVTDMLSLVHFQALKSLTLEVGLLYNILNGRQKKHSVSNWKLAPILPRSIEELEISERRIRHSQQHFEGFLRGLADFVECKVTTHPNLRTICLGIIQVDYDSDPDFERLCGICRDQNVLLESSV